MPVSSKSRKEGLPNTNAENVGTLPTIFAPLHTLQIPWLPKIVIEGESLRWNL